MPPAPPGLGEEGPLTLKVCFRLMLSEGCTAATRKLRRGTLPRTLSSFSSAEETSTEPRACPQGGWGAQRLSLSVINTSEPLLPTACLSGTGAFSQPQERRTPWSRGAGERGGPADTVRLGELTFLGATDKHVRADIWEYLQCSS